MDLESYTKTLQKPIAVALRNGESLEEQKKQYLQQLNHLANEIRSKFGSTKYTIDGLKELWGANCLTCIALFSMDVACLLKLKVLQEDDMIGFMVCG